MYFSNLYTTKWKSIWCQINRKSIITSQIWFNSSRLRKRHWLENVNPKQCKVTSTFQDILRFLRHLYQTVGRGRRVYADHQLGSDHDVVLLIMVIYKMQSTFFLRLQGIFTHWKKKQIMMKQRYKLAVIIRFYPT